MAADLPPAGIVRYGAAALSDVLPAVLAALGIPGESNALDLPAADTYVVLLIDGLGWNLLRADPAAAPFLSGLAARELTAGFPTTTAASVTSLGTGLPSGAHGIVGYTTRERGLGEPMNWLRWSAGNASRNLIAELPPEQVQPQPTAIQRADRAGIAATVLGAASFRESGLTRVALRGGTYVPVFTAADVVTAAATAARQPGLVYCYLGDLDMIGHVWGCHAEAWRVQLTLIDFAVRMLADRLPGAVRLLVTADHGMVDVPDRAKIDYDDEPDLREGVAMLAGEARARYVYAAPGQLDAVRRRWSDRLGDRMAVLSRDEAIERGWFGPAVTATARDRIGDLVVLATGDAAVVRRSVEKHSSKLIGNHGALTDDELLVPLLLR